MKKRNKNIGGNYYNKHQSKNLAVKYLMNKFHQELFGLIKKTRCKNLLDVGCGEGHTTKLIHQEFPKIKIAASDIDAPIVKNARKNNPAIKFSQESATSLKRKGSSFDLVLMTEVLEHLTNPTKAIKEARRVSKKFVIFTVPNEPLWRIANMCRLKYLKEFGNTPGHIQHWNRKTLYGLLKKNFDKVMVKNVYLWTMACCMTTEKRQ